MMNKHIFYYLMVGSMALLLGACNDSMNDLLEPKVYFESKEYNFSVEDEMDVMTFDLAGGRYHVLSGGNGGSRLLCIEVYCYFRTFL